jgi:TetR/AcrR family transcriptional repressor of nem operon
MSLREEKKRLARNDILQAARELIDQRGFEQARMRDIATRANISYQTLYNYFPTKGSVLQALLLAYADDFAAEIEQEITSYQGNLLATLNRVNEISLAIFNAEERDLWRRATIELLQPEMEQIGMVSIIKSRTLGVMELLLRRAQEFGELDAAAPVALIAETLFELTDYAFLRFLIDSSLQPQALLSHLGDQSHLILQPYLRSTAEPG